MFDIKWIRDNAAAFDAARARRALAPLAQDLLELDEKRRAAISALQQAQERRNAASREIGLALRDKDTVRADQLKAEVSAIKEGWPELEEAERNAAFELETALAREPNLPLPDTPDGVDENDNVQIRVSGTKPNFTQDFKPREHFEIGESLGLMDFESAARMSGARFVVLKGDLARLERALMQFMLDLHTGENGYTEIDPPVLVRDEAMFGTAQLPKFRDDQFAAGDGYWLIPTAEVVLTNLARDRVLEESQLPIRMTAGTLCFRAEAGAAGRDTRGMIRQHQFKKVELVSITTPEQAMFEHERMTRCAEKVLTRLGLAFRTMLLCAGDMGFSSIKTYDLEVWLPGQNRYREISSCSVCGDFQARRMNARFRPSDGKNLKYVTTLNGSGLAVGRALAAVLENYQTEDGAVVIPDVLRPYMGGRTRIERKG